MVRKAKQIFYQWQANYLIRHQEVVGFENVEETRSDWETWPGRTCIRCHLLLPYNASQNPVLYNEKQSS